MICPYLIKLCAEERELNNLTIFIDTDNLDSTQIVELTDIAIFLAFDNKRKDQIIFCLNDNATEAVLRTGNFLSRFFYYLLNNKKKFQDLNERIKIKQGEHYKRLSAKVGGGFSKTGLPLIPLDTNIYSLFQNNIHDFLGEKITENFENPKTRDDYKRKLTVNSWLDLCKIFFDKYDYYNLKSTVIKVYCGIEYIETMNRFDIRDDKYNTIKEKLKNTNVITFFLFSSILNNIYISSEGEGAKSTKSIKTKILRNLDAFTALIERCETYGAGILQLIENTLCYTQGGFLSIRGFDKKGIQIGISDIANNIDKKYKDMLEVFLENVSTSESPIEAKNITLKNLFFPQSSEEMMTHLANANNITNHYGLQIFANAVSSVNGGDFKVISGNAQSFKCVPEKDEEMQKLAYYCGTQYDIRLTIDGLIENDTTIDDTNLKIVNKIYPFDLTFDNPNKISAPIEIPIDRHFYINGAGDREVFDTLISVFSKKCTKKELSKYIKEKTCYIKKLAELLEDNLTRLMPQESDCNVLQINLIKDEKNDNNDFFYYEYLAKMVFSFLAKQKKVRNIVLNTFPNEDTLLIFYRYYSRFYDRFGYSKIEGKSPQLLLVFNSDNKKCKKSTDVGYVTISGAYLGNPVFDYRLLSGGYFNDNGFLESSINNISRRSDYVKNINTTTRLDPNNPHYFDEVKLSEESDSQKWKVDLKSILTTNISNQNKYGVLVKTNTTHIQVNGVHIDRFYQVHSIFTNAYWSSKFGTWLAESLAEQLKDKEKTIILYGFERLTEPLMLKAKEILSNQYRECDYLIYNSGYHCTAESVTNPKVSGFDSSFEKIKNNNAIVIFIMSISTTLSTFFKMEKALIDTVNKDCIKKAAQMNADLSKDNYKFFTVIQLIDTSGNNFHEQYFNINKQDKVITMALKETNAKEITYLTAVPAVWSLPKDCTMCYADDNGREIAIYSTDDTSLVPSFMIEQHKEIAPVTLARQREVVPLSLFEKNKDANYKYKNCLLYGHVYRDSAHHSGFIRTDELLELALALPREDQSFKNWIESVSRELKATNGFSNDGEEKITNGPLSTIDVIISPYHYSNLKFPNIINQSVFKEKAHIISIDVKKIFRSNFLAEFSNYSKLSSLLNESDITKKKLRFIYVDDTINSGNTYYRVKSLMNSLLKNHNALFDFEFYAVILLLDRHSNASRKSYFKGNNYFSCFKLETPYIRSDGDSCPLCKRVSIDKQIIKFAALDSTAAIAIESYSSHQAKELSVKEKENIDASLQERHFRRLNVADDLWIKLKEINDVDNAEKTIKEYIREQNIYNNEEAIEYYISIAKVITRPFFSYKPHIATAAISILKYFIEQIVTTKTKIKFFEKSYVEKTNSYETDENKTKRAELLVSLLIVCSSGLANLNSTYLLNTTNLTNILEKFSDLQKYLSKNKFFSTSCADEKSSYSDRNIFTYYPDKNFDVIKWDTPFNRSFADYLRYAVFYSVRSIPFGKGRRKKFDDSLIEVISENEQKSKPYLKQFFTLLYLENGEKIDLSYNGKSKLENWKNSIINDTDEEKTEMKISGSETKNVANQKEHDEKCIIELLSKSIPYIDKEVIKKDSDNNKDTNQSKLTLIPLTTKGSVDAYYTGFNIHFGKDCGSCKTKYSPIVSAISEATGQLCGHISLDTGAVVNLNKFGISTLNFDNHEKDDKYVFIKISNARYINFAKDIISKIPPIYLRFNRGDLSCNYQLDDAIRILDNIRSILNYRYELLKTIANDMSSDDMKELIYERNYNRALDISKSVRHGEVAEDIKERPNKPDEAKLLTEYRDGFDKLLANRMLSTVYRAESTLYENKIMNEISSASAPYEAKLNYKSINLKFSEMMKLYTKNQFFVYSISQKGGKLIRGKVKNAKECEISERLLLKDAKSLNCFKENFLTYSKNNIRQSDNILLWHWITLLAHNAIRHFVGGIDRENYDFAIEKDGTSIICTSIIGTNGKFIEKLSDDDTYKYQVIKAMAIPPYIRAKNKDNNEGTDPGITLWTLVQYLYRINIEKGKKECNYKEFLDIIKIKHDKSDMVYFEITLKDIIKED